MKMKDRIFKFLNKNYPIDRNQDNLIDISFNENIGNIVKEVFGITDITFDDWKADTCGNIYGYQCTKGGKYWYQDGLKHRDNDKPAIIYPDGTKHWYINGKLHREDDKPAMISANGAKYWFSNGERHRDNDKPTIITASGAKFWHKNGKQYKPIEK